MAVLSNADRASLWASVMVQASQSRTQFGALTKVDLRAALDAADNWADANAAAYNAALPLPARTVLTAQQKALLLSVVVRRRYEVS